MQGGVGVLGYYSRSLSKALMDLYPNIGLDHQLFLRRPRIIFIFYLLLLFHYYSFHLHFSNCLFYSIIENFWQEKSNQRKFFDAIARKKHFNPLIASNWYPITHRNIVTQKVKLKYYNIIRFIIYYYY